MEDIEGETLGEKHKNFNILVQSAIKENPNRDLEDIDYSHVDIDNLFKIDFACRTRNVDYLLKVFKCEDMLYISRAIKHSVWLIKDAQYSNIISPQYLHSNLLPFMMTGAVNKFMLSVRLNLKDPIRYEEFFEYLKDRDLDDAMKFLPYCSSAFILSTVVNLINLVPDHMMLRLFSCNFEIFRICCKVQKEKPLLLDKALFLIRKHGEEVFDILDSLKSECLPTLNVKYTKLAMKTCPRRIMFNFNHYAKHIDLPTFVKYIKTDCVKEFITKNAESEEVKRLFNADKQGKILKPNDNGVLLSRLIDCDPNNLELCREVLQNFSAKLSEKMDNPKFIYQFLDIFMKKFKTHRFDQNMWCMYNNIFEEINIKKHSQRNKTLQSYIKSIIAYTIIHDENISEDVLLNFEFYTFKSELKKFDKGEQRKVFDFLFNFVIVKLETLPLSNIDEILLWMDRIVMLLKHWNRNINNYPYVLNKIISIISYLKDSSDIEDLQKLYNRTTFWRKWLFNKFIAIDPKACVNILKHDPKLLYLYENEVLACSSSFKTYQNFYCKIRTYWPNTLAKYFKALYLQRYKTLPTMFGLCFLLTRSEFSDLVISNIPNTKEGIEDVALCKTIAKNIQHVRPKASIDTSMLFAKGVYMLDAISSINSLLIRMSVHEFHECLYKYEDSPVLQKLCVWVAFSKRNIDIRKPMILKIWQETKHTSVKCEIIKMYTNTLAKYVKKDWSTYLGIIRAEWQSLEFLMENLSNNEVIIQTLPSKVRRLPRTIRSEYYLKSYNLINNLAPKCRTFPRLSFMHYIFSLQDLDNNLLAEMIDKSITKRLWRTKLPSNYINILTSCLFTWKSDEEQVISFEKVIAPVFNGAYKMWNKKTSGFYVVQYNIKNIVTGICRKLFNISNDKRKLPPTILTILLESLEKNIPIKDNYIMITKLKLGVEYLKILARLEKIKSYDDDKIFNETTQELATLCIKMLCEDVASYSTCIWRLFYHSLQMMLDEFGMGKSTQFKVYNCMLDLCAGLSSELDVLVHILVLELSFYANDWCVTFFFVDDDDDDAHCLVDNKGQQALLERIKQHASLEVKANYSKVLLSHLDKVYYTKLSYSERLRVH